MDGWNDGYMDGLAAHIATAAQYNTLVLYLLIHRLQLQNSSKNGFSKSQSCLHGRIPLILLYPSFKIKQTTPLFQDNRTLFEILKKLNMLS